MKKSIRNMARPVMVQGTSSHVGKSVLVAALCRILRDKGYSVAPFKAQNMALNSFVTRDGAEIGRAQAFQAYSAGIEPSSDHNPVLLKPSSDKTSQVIIHGKVYGVMSALEYHAFKPRARKFVVESYSRLAQGCDCMVIEGAGSPAEVNLRKNDIANMGMAEIADSPVIIAGDIDRGGVFASLVGTMELLTEGERTRVKGFLINKFRGDMALLKPGLAHLKRKTGVATLGVIPYINGVVLPDEDSVSLEDACSKGPANSGDISIRVVKLPRISNFTDFDPLRLTPGVRVDFIDAPAKVEGAHIVIIPGSKNTIEDLRWLKRNGFSAAITAHRKGGGMVAGICGGFQILGNAIKDPYGVESKTKAQTGLGLLDAVTVLKKDKKTFQASAVVGAAFTGGRTHVDGYEIHMGETSCNERPFSRIVKRGFAAVDVPDGGVSADGRVWGTYLHGIFDNDGFRNSLLSSLKKGGRAALGSAPASYSALKEDSLARLARTVEANIDMSRILKIIGI